MVKIDFLWGLVRHQISTIQLGSGSRDTRYGPCIASRKSVRAALRPSREDGGAVGELMFAWCSGDHPAPRQPGDPGVGR
jgi:hypothetical protein